MNKVKNIIKKILISNLFVVTIFILVASLCKVGINSPIINSSTSNSSSVSADGWSSSKGYIENTQNLSQVVYININSLINEQTLAPLNPSGIITNASNTYIKINNGVDLYYFSILCNSSYKSSYLTYNYILGADIDYNDAAKTFKLFKPVGWGSTPFSGTFDGLGFTISNLFIYKINSDEDYEQNFVDGSYQLQYIAMISELTGTVKNVCFKDANIIQTTDSFSVNGTNIEITNASVVVGYNSGIIDHVSVIDLRGENSGITCEGTIVSTSYLAGANDVSGLIKDSFVAFNYITSTSVIFSQVNSVAPVVFNNSGTLTNVYYDIDTSYLDGAFKNVDGVTGINTADFQDVELFSVNNGWYTNTTYQIETGSTIYGSFLGLTYPTTLGLNVIKNGSNHTFIIEKPEQFAYFFKIIDYSPFAQASYIVTKNINMAKVSDKLMTTNPNVFTGTLSGLDAISEDSLYQDLTTSDYVLSLSDGSVSRNATIYNIGIYEGVSYYGYHNYGLFGTLSGTVTDINFTNIEVRPLDLSSNHAGSTFSEPNSFGSICGTLASGKIRNVNVSVDITLNNSTSANYLGSNYVGGICGYAEGGSIIDSTASGTIVGSTQSITISDASMLGGIIGYNNHLDIINNVRSNVDIEAIRYRSNTSVNQFIGGVIGLGKLVIAENLQNDGDLYVGVTLNNKTYSSNQLYYGTVYLGGVIGLVQEASQTAGQFLNNADIYYYANDYNYIAYISGAFNAMSSNAFKYNVPYTSDSMNTISSLIESSSNNKKMSFKSVSSGGTLNISNKLSASKESGKLVLINSTRTSTNANKPTPDLTGVDIRTAGLIYSYLTPLKLEGLYTLNYKYTPDYTCTSTVVVQGQTYNQNDKISKNEYDLLTNEQKGHFTNRISNGNQQIDISLIDEYAPCVNSDNLVFNRNGYLYTETNALRATSALFTFSVPRLNTFVEISKGYNYRNIDYITTKTVKFYTLQLSGNLNGRNFSVVNLRNEGNIYVYFTQAASETKIDAYKSTIYGDYKKIKIYGCLEEINQNCSAVDVYNGGDITLSSSATNQNSLMVVYNIYIGGICYKNVGTDIDLDKSNQLMLPSGYRGSLHNCVNDGDIKVTNVEGKTGYFYGESRIGGIACFNCATISSCFNLGNITNINWCYSKNNNTYGTFDGDFEVETGGFSFITQNDPIDNNTYTRSNIIDSANNGTIISCTTSTNGWVNAGGFVVRNERCESGPTIDTADGRVNNVNANEQKILYSINYGDVYAYNQSGNDYGSGSEPNCKAAGFICLGTCSIIDIINYGNIYSKKVVGGMFGYVYFERFIGGSTIEEDGGSKVHIANAINYGKTVSISQLTGDEYYNIPSVAESKAVAYSGSNPNGALIGMARSVTSTSIAKLFSCLDIKNLINFYDSANMVGRVYQFATPNAGANSADRIAINNALQYMATTKPTDDSPVPFYSANNYGIKSYYKSEVDPVLVNNPTVAQRLSQSYNGGIFNKEYTLRKAPPLVDVNGQVVLEQEDADPNNTDNYISDYIQFIPFSKVNDYLVQKINLDSTIYQTAMDALLSDKEALSEILRQKLLTKNDSEVRTIYNSLTSHAQYQNAKNATMNDSVAINYILSAYLQNHQSIEEQYQFLMAILESNLFTIDDLFGSSSNLLSILSNIASSHTFTNEMYQELFNNFLNTLSPISQSEFLQLFDEEAINEIRESILSNPSSTLVDDLYEQIVTLRQTNEVLNNPSYTSSVHNSFLSSLFSDVDDNDLLQFTNGIPTSTKVLNMFLRNLNKVKSISNTDKNALFNALNPALSLSLLYDNATTDALKRDLLTLISALPEFNTRYVYQPDGYIYIQGQSLTHNNASLFEGVGLRVNNVGVQSNTGVNYTGKWFRTNSGSYVEASSQYSGSQEASVRSSTTGTRYNVSGNVFTYNRNGSYSITDVNQNAATHPYTYYTKTSSGSIWNQRNTYTFNGFGTYARIKKNNGSNYNYQTFDMVLVNYLLNDFFTYYNALSTSQKQSIVNNGSLQIMNYYLNNCIPEPVTTLVNNANDYDEIIQILNRNNIFYEPKIDIINLTYEDASLFHNVLSYIDDLASFSVNDKVKVLNTFIKYSTTNHNILDDYIYDYLAIDHIDECVLNLASSNLNLLIDFIEYLHNKSLINSNDLSSLLNAILNSENNKNVLTIIENLYKNNSSLVDKEDISYVIASYASQNSTLYQYILNNYFGINMNNSNKEALFNSLTSDVNIDTSPFTDVIGIYALASSYGIKNGMFLPDNIKLINIDPYDIIEGEVINDSSWRGGTSINPNAYSLSDTSTVNYKIFYTMKQLKKSISTVVFRTELIDNTGEYIVTNDVEIDYDIDNSIIDYYVSINSDELKQESITINQLNYELAYGATFDSVETVMLDYDTLTTGDILNLRMVVQAEDITVKQVYDVRIHVTAAKALNSLDSIRINQNQANANYSSFDSGLSAILNNQTSYINAMDGRLRVNYKVVNIPDGTSLSNSIKLYKYDGNTYPNSITSIQDNITPLTKDWSLTDIPDNGIVRVEEGTFLSLDTYELVVLKNGQLVTSKSDLVFDITISDYLEGGYYVLEFELNESDGAKYYTVFEKVKNSLTGVYSIEFGDATYFDEEGTKTSNTNINDRSYILYGEQITRSLLEELDDSPLYDDEDCTYNKELSNGLNFKLKLSPGVSSYSIDNISYSQDESGYVTYHVRFVITAESGNVGYFDFYLYENEVNPTLFNSYKDGKKIIDNNLSNGFDDTFSKQLSPSYVFEYDLSSFYFESGSSQNLYLSLANGQTIIDSLKLNHLEEIDNNISGDITTRVESLIDLTYQWTSSNNGITLNYLNSAFSSLYNYDLLYRNSHQFDDANEITHEYLVGTINITKEKNKLSYLESISFVSDTVVTALDTIFSESELAVFENDLETSIANFTNYKYLLNNGTNRKIVSLPNRIYYNEYDETTGNKLDRIYGVGLVDRTSIISYSPIFTVPKDSEIYLMSEVRNVLYRNMLFEDSLGNLRVFLVSESGDSALDLATGFPEVTFNASTFEVTCDSTTYTLSNLSGTSSINNISLLYDFSVMTTASPTSGILENFNFAQYRVYSENYDVVTNNDNSTYTDFFISVQDITNNVILKVNITLDDNILASQSEITEFVNKFNNAYMYLQISNYQKDEFTNELVFNNMMGSFTHFSSETSEFAEINYKTNTSGTFVLDFDLANQYSFSLKANKKGKLDNLVLNENDLFFEVPNSITSQIIEVYITIHHNEAVDYDWGFHEESKLSNNN